MKSFFNAPQPTQALRAASSLETRFVNDTQVSSSCEHQTTPKPPSTTEPRVLNLNTCATFACSDVTTCSESPVQQQRSDMQADPVSGSKWDVYSSNHSEQSFLQLLAKERLSTTNHDSHSTSNDQSKPAHSSSSVIQNDLLDSSQVSSSRSMRDWLKRTEDKVPDSSNVGVTPVKGFFNHIKSNHSSTSTSSQSSVHMLSNCSKQSSTKSLHSAKRHSIFFQNPLDSIFKKDQKLSSAGKAEGLCDVTNVSSPSTSASDVASSSCVAVEDHMMCEKCRKLIPMWEMPEHTDYHLALELQSQFSATSQPPATSSKYSSQSSQIPGRGLKRKTLDSSQKTPSIMKFFARKNESPSKG